MVQALVIVHTYRVVCDAAAGLAATQTLLLVGHLRTPGKHKKEYSNLDQ